MWSFDPERRRELTDYSLLLGFTAVLSGAILHPIADEVSNLLEAFVVLLR
jgi:hypothetical protein